MDRLRTLLADNPDILSRQPLLKRMLTGLREDEAEAVASILEIMIRKRRLR